MKLCLLFHCLCRSYDELPARGRELYVSVQDMRTMLEALLARGYSFTSMDAEGSDTATITFDDGYFNNTLFAGLSDEFSIPYIIFVSAYYMQSGAGFPWLEGTGNGYDAMKHFDYYRWRQGQGDNGTGRALDPMTRPVTYDELRYLADSGRMEIGCHGYYHQPLSRAFEGYLDKEQELALDSLRDNLGLRPRFFGLANGLYTPRVMRGLLKSFDRVFTIGGRPFRPADRVVHRLSLVNPQMGGPLVHQIDRHLGRLRQLKRTVITARRRWL